MALWAIFDLFRFLVAEDCTLGASTVIKVDVFHVSKCHRYGAFTESEALQLLAQVCQFLFLNGFDVGAV